MFNWIKTKIKPVCKCCGGEGKLYKKTVFSDYVEKHCVVCLMIVDFSWADKYCLNIVDSLIQDEFRNGFKRKNCKYKFSGIFGEVVEITQEK